LEQPDEVDIIDSAKVLRSE
jgi:hypothetical protein